MWRKTLVLSIVLAMVLPTEKAGAEPTGLHDEAQPQVSASEETVAMAPAASAVPSDIKWAHHLATGFAALGAIAGAVQVGDICQYCRNETTALTAPSWYTKSVLVPVVEDETPLEGQAYNWGQFGDLEHGKDISQFDNLWDLIQKKYAEETFRLKVINALLTLTGYDVSLFTSIRATINNFGNRILLLYPNKQRVEEQPVSPGRRHTKSDEYDPSCFLRYQGMINNLGETTFVPYRSNPQSGSANNPQSGSANSQGLSCDNDSYDFSIINIINIGYKKIYIPDHKGLIDFGWGTGVITALFALATGWLYRHPPVMKPEAASLKTLAAAFTTVVLGMPVGVTTLRLGTACIFSPREPKGFAVQLLALGGMLLCKTYAALRVGYLNHKAAEALDDETDEGDVAGDETEQRERA